MLFKKKEHEKRIRWKIEIDGLNMDRMPQYTVHKARSPYGWDYICHFTDLDQAKRFVMQHMEFPIYFYEGDSNV